MSSLYLRLNTDAVDRFTEALENYEGYAGDAINEVMWNIAGPMIADRIVQLLPRSGKTWRGKPKAAAETMPFFVGKLTLGVAVKNTAKYGYLYFPNDGSTTIKHAGNQQFMWRGAIDCQDEIIDLCTARLKIMN